MTEDMGTEMEEESQNWLRQQRKARNRHLIGQLSLALIFMVSIFLSDYILDSFSGLLSKILATALPIFAITLWTWLIYGQIRKLEEFQRSLALKSFAATFAIILWALTCYELTAQIFTLPAFPVIMLAPFVVVLWQIIWEVLRKRYT